MDGNDMELVREFVARNSEAAFATLVKRNVDLVYSVARRKVGDPHLAEEVTQAVFILLARKAASLGPATILSAWLCRTARYAAADALKLQSRRRDREREAHMRSEAHETESPDWRQIAPLLDAAMEQLDRPTHDAVVMRFFQRGSFREVAEALGTSEAAAKMRVARALEKLRRFFAKRGVSISTTAIATAAAAGFVESAPAMVTTSVTAMAGKGAAASGSTLAIVEATGKGMLWVKAKAALMAATGAVAAAGAVTATVAVVTASHPAAWQVYPPPPDILERTAPQVQVLPTRFPSKGNTTLSAEDRRMLGLNQSVEQMIRAAHGASPARVIFPAGLPTTHYDYISNLPSGAAEALQERIRQVIGLSARRETRAVTALVLRVANPHAPGLKPAANPNQNASSFGASNITLRSRSLSALVEPLEGALKVPVLDGTGLDGKFDVDLEWNNEPEGHVLDPTALKQALRDQLGLELVPTDSRVAMWIVEWMPRAEAGPQTSTRKPIATTEDAEARGLSAADRARLDEFRRRQAVIPDAAIDQEIEIIVQQNFAGDRAAFRRTLKSQAVPEAAFRKFVADQLALQAMRSEARRSRAGENAAP